MSKTKIHRKNQPEKPTSKEPGKPAWVLWFKILLWVYLVVAGIAFLQFTGVLFSIVFNLFLYISNVQEYGFATIVASFMYLFSGAASIAGFLGAVFGVQREKKKSSSCFILAVVFYLIYLMIGPAFSSALLSGQPVSFAALLPSLLFNVLLPLFFVYAYRKLPIEVQSGK